MGGLRCEAECHDCEWTQTGTDMQAMDKAAAKHGRAQGHSWSWHCEPARAKE